MRGLQKPPRGNHIWVEIWGVKGVMQRSRVNMGKKSADPDENHKRDFGNQKSPGDEKVTASASSLGLCALLRSKWQNAGKPKMLFKPHLTTYLPAAKEPWARFHLLLQSRKCDKCFTEQQSWTLTSPHTFLCDTHPVYPNKTSHLVWFSWPTSPPLFSSLGLALRDDQTYLPYRQFSGSRNLSTTQPATADLTEAELPDASNHPRRNKAQVKKGL